MLCRRSRFAQAGAAASAQSCAWPSVIGGQDDNRIIPDSAAYYWDQPIVATSSVRITVSGTYPDARYFSLRVYAPYGAPFSQNCVTSSLPDYRIEPSPGSVNPWQHRAAPGGRFEVTIDPKVARGEANVLPLPPGLSASHPGYLYRFRTRRGSCDLRFGRMG